MEFKLVLKFFRVEEQYKEGKEKEILDVYYL